MNAMERAVRQKLDACGLPWSMENSRRGRKIRINGHLVGMVSYARGDRNYDLLELESAIRKARALGPKTNG